MRLVLCTLFVIAVSQGASGFLTGFPKHKSETALARMTPERLVDEYCTEYIRHRYDVLDRYRNVLEDYISRDAVNAMLPSARIIDQYDPTTQEGGSKTRGDRADAVWILLLDLDSNFIRLRASEEGRVAIESIRRLVQRMEAAHFDARDEYDYWRQGRYNILRDYLQEAEGINYCDEAIRHTLTLKYRKAMSDEALLQFVTYLIAKDSRYPGWSKREQYEDLTQRNEAGNTIGYLIMKNPEPFYNAYLEYQVKFKQRRDRQEEALSRWHSTRPDGREKGRVPPEGGAQSVRAHSTIQVKAR